MSRPAPTRPVSPTPRERFLDLSLTQVVGGSLAAATAAALGSRLGLVGTIAGAGLISVVSAVAASVYTQSLRRTRARLRRERPLRTADTQAGALVTAPDTAAATGPGRPGPLSRRTLVTRSLLGATAVFVITALTVTGWELATGSSLSGGGATTVSQVAGRSAAASTTVDPEQSVRTGTTGRDGTGQAGTGTDPADTASGTDQPEEGSGTSGTPDDGASEPSEPSPTPEPADPEPSPVDPSAPVDPSQSVDPAPAG